MKKLYTVTEYANLVGKDPGNIRRMLLEGRLEGEKLGKQWVIKEGTEYPVDARIRSGKYCGQRKRNKFNKENPALKKPLKQMEKLLKDVYGDSLNEIKLYGSYARGTQTAESDIDVAVILKKRQTEKMHDEMTDGIVDIELEYGVVLSIILIECDEFAKWKHVVPFYINLCAEGITLWKAA